MNDNGWWSLLLTVLACGLGTFLLRALPFWWGLRQGAERSRLIRRWSAAIAPAAIATLLVASVFPLLWPAEGPTRALPAAVAVGAVILIHRLRGGLAVPTLLGTAVYALMLGLSGSE
jgi:branched-subunit amino acid transport protein AzlD